MKVHIEKNIGPLRIFLDIHKSTFYHMPPVWYFNFMPSWHTKGGRP